MSGTALVSRKVCCNVIISFELRKGNSMKLWYDNPAYINELFRHDEVYFMWALLFLKQNNIPKDAIILDVGAGVGSLVKVLRQFGFKNAYGVEINETLVNVGKERLGLEGALFTQKEFESHVEKYDVVISYTVAEHVDDIGEFIDYKLKFLKDDGYFYLYAPDYHRPRMYKNIIIDKIKGKKLHLTPFTEGGVCRSIYMFLKITFFCISKRIIKKPYMLKVVPLPPEVSVSADADATWCCSYLDIKNFFYANRKEFKFDRLDCFGSFAGRVYKQKTINKS